MYEYTWYRFLKMFEYDTLYYTVLFNLVRKQTTRRLFCLQTQICKRQLLSGQVYILFCPIRTARCAKPHVRILNDVHNCNYSTN